jgi:hypothetical protein
MTGVGASADAPLTDRGREDSPQGHRAFRVHAPTDAVECERQTQGPGIVLDARKTSMRVQDVMTPIAAPQSGAGTGRLVMRSTP